MNLLDRIVRLIVASMPRVSRRCLGLAGVSKYTPHQGAQEKARRVRQRGRGWYEPKATNR